MRKWVANILPSELLKRTVKEAVESLVTLSLDGNFYKNFPDEILTPDYGDKWGVRANYIEINNRAIAEMYGADVAETVTIQYGGSMNAKNADELLAKENVDGGLIGGASLKAEDFSVIVKAASK